MQLIRGMVKNGAAFTVNYILQNYIQIRKFFTMDFKKKVADLKSQIQDKKAAAGAFLSLAELENRDLSEDEKAQFDNICDVDIVALGADLERFAKLAAFADETPLKQEDLTELKGSDIVNNDAPQKIIVPAVAKRHIPLKAFTGQDAEENAYTAGRWILATVAKDQSSINWCDEHGVSTMKNALSEGVNADGGYTTPIELEVSITALRDAHGVFRQNAGVTPMSSDVKQYTRPIGGIVAAFAAEGVTVSESDSQWKQVQLVAKKIMALTRMSSELNEDSVISIAEQVARDIAYAFAEKEDDCGFNGDGTGTYGSITGLKSALLATSRYEAAAGNTAFSTLDLADFESLVGQLPHYAEANAKFYISKAGYSASMLPILNAAGGNTKADLAGESVLSFLGYPVVITQAMNSVLSAQVDTDGLVYFGDLNLAASFGNRTGMSFKTDESVHFLTDEIAMKGTQRFDIVISEPGAVSGDAGPIISLDTPSA